VLGSINWMMYQDVAGLQARMDNKVELWPIDMGYDHFATGNVSYHGSNLSIVWQKPGGTTYYPTAPAGYSLYVDGKRVLTIADLTHVTWDPASGSVQVADGTAVNYHAAAHLVTADQVDLSGNAR